MKVSKLLLIIALVLISVTVLFACDDPDATLYTIIYDVNNGDGEDILVLTNGRQPIVMPADPIRAGYDFLGWYFDLEGKVELTEHYFITNPVRANQRVYALWQTSDIPDGKNPNDGSTPEQKPTYTITYHSVNMTPRSNTSHSPLVSTISTTNLNPEHEFKGWYTNPEFEGNAVTLPLELTEDISLYARWERMRYAIVFAPGDGATGLSPTIPDKAMGETFILPENPFTRVNHQFIEWHDGFQSYQPGDEYPMLNRSAITFTANWARAYVASFHGGEGAEGSIFTLPPTIGGKTFVMPQSTFTKAGHIFNVWTDGETTFPAGSSNIMPYTDQRYEATWTRAYNLDFEGGEAAFGNPPTFAPMPEGAKVKLPSNPFTKDGFEFMHWEDTNGNEYNPGFEFTVPARNVSFVAVWQPTITYPVSFAPGEGATGDAPHIESWRPGSIIQLPDNPFEKNYYRFEGWEHSSVVYPAGANFVMPDYPTSFEAKWTPINYSIRYHIMEGYVSSNPTLYNVETPTFSLADPEVDGYTFEGWYSDQGLLYPVETTTIVLGSVGNLEFFAKLAPLAYKIYFTNLQGATLTNVEPDNYIEVSYGKDYSESFSRVGADRSGYLLAFWAYEGRAYSPTAVWNRTEDLELAAVWTEIATFGLTFAPTADNSAYVITRYNGQDTEVIIPSYHEKKPVIGISIAAFNQSAITAISLPETLLTISDEAFKASRLTKITLPASLTAIGNYAFADTNYLEVVTVEEDAMLYQIGEGAFYNSSALGYVRLPETVVQVGKSAFGGSPALAIYSSAIGAANGFAQDWNIDNVPVFWSVMREGSFYYAPEGEGFAIVEYIGNENIPNINETVLGVPVVAIGGYAFRNNTSLEGLTVPARVTRIAEGAFINAVALQYVYVPIGVGSLAANTFNGANFVTVYAEGELTYSGDVFVNSNIAEVFFEGDWHFVAHSSTTVRITKYTGIMSTVTIPETLLGKPVVAVASGAFSNVSTLSSVTIPENIAEMGSNVFANTTLSISALTQKPVAWTPGWNSGRTIEWGYTVVSGGQFDYVEYDGKAYIVAHQQGLSSVEIPETIGGLPVVGVYGALNNDSAIRTVFIPSTVDEVVNTLTGTPAAVIYTAYPAPKSNWINWNPDELPVHYSSRPYFASDGYVVTLDGDKANITGYTATPTSRFTLPEEVQVDGIWYEVNGVGTNAFYNAGLVAAIFTKYYIAANAFAGNPHLVINYVGTESDTESYGENWHGGAPVYYGLETTENDFYFTVQDDYAIITAYIGSDTEVYVPHKVGDFYVRQIGARALLNSNVASVYLPYTVVDIAPNAINALAATHNYFDLQGEDGDYSFIAYNAGGNLDVYLTDYHGSESMVTLPLAISSAGEVVGLVDAFNNKAVSIINAHAGINLILGTFAANTTIFFEGGEDTLGIFADGASIYYNAGEVLSDLDFRYIVADAAAVIIGYNGSDSDVTVPDTLGGAEVKAILSGVFAQRYNLYVVRIPAAVTDIKNGTFEGSNAVKVYLARELLVDEALWYLDITLVAGKTIFAENNIEYYVENDRAVIVGYAGGEVSLTVPAIIGGYTVTKLNEKAFYGKSEIMQIIIPATIVEIGRDAFAECGEMIIKSEAHYAHPNWDADWNSGLTVIFGEQSYMQDDNFKFIVYEGNAYLLEYIGAGNQVAVGENIAYGGNTYPVVDLGVVFANNKTITALTLPDNIANIFPAIKGATSLESIYIPAAVKEIPDYAFSGFKKLKSVAFGADDTLTSIGYRAFYDCVLLVNFDIPSTVSYIGDEAFKNCGSLQSITLPYGITEIGKGVFENCFGITQVAALSSITLIGENAFKNAQALSSFDAENVQEIGASAFEGTKALANIKLGNALETIGKRAFAGAVSLREINISSAEIIADEAFKGATYLTVKNQIINAAYIGNSAFEGAINLRLANGLGSTILSVGTRAFYNAGYFGELLIPHHLTYIGLEAFAGAGIESIIVDPNNPMYSSSEGVLYNKAESALLQYPALSTAIEFVVTARSIAPSAFLNARMLGTVILPSNVKSAGKDAFKGCLALTIYSEHTSSPLGFDAGFNSSNRPIYWRTPEFEGVYGGIVYIQNGESITISGFNGTAESINIPSEINNIPVTAIGSYAFAYSNIKWVQIPDSVTEIGEYAFAGARAAIIYCEAETLPSGYVAGWNASFDAKGSAITLPVYLGGDIREEGGFQFVEINDTAVITKYIGVNAFIAIPTTLDELTVTQIGKFAFADTSLRSVHIPESVTNISASAFKGSGYTVIYTAATSLKQGWETGFNNLRPVYYNVGAVGYQDGFEYIVVDGSVHITRYRTSGANVIIPASLGGRPVTAILGYAFAGVDTLIKVEIPSTVTAIGNYAFAACGLLENAVLGLDSQLRSIGTYAFQNNKSLTSFWLPGSVISIEYSVFNGCTELTELTYYYGNDVPVGWVRGWNYIYGEYVYITLNA
ncbi:MAG: leucine-rich repeat protein [Clostridia bacterium]